MKELVENKANLRKMDKNKITYKLNLNDSKNLQ